jgi:Tfp pilus assembly protein PilN
MSLGLPDFGPRGRADASPRLWRALNLVGFAVLAYTLGTAALLWSSINTSNRSLDRAREDLARQGRAADESRRALKKRTDLLTAVASVESSPAQVLADLKDVLPPGVSVPSVRVEYSPEARARVDLTVVATSADAYDRFLGALSTSERFAEIKPGAEARPGLVRATVSAVHRPAVTAR